MAKTTRLKIPFVELKTDPRRTVSAEHQKEFLDILQHYIQSQMTQGQSFKLLNLWLLHWDPVKKCVHASIQDSVCAASRWLKTNWDGDLLDYMMFKRFFGVVSGSAEFHSMLVGLQQQAKLHLPEPHALHTATNLSFMIQCLLAALTSQSKRGDVSLGNIGVVQHTFNTGGDGTNANHHLKLSPGKMKIKKRKAKTQRIPVTS